MGCWLMKFLSLEASQARAPAFEAWRWSIAPHGRCPYSSPRPSCWNIRSGTTVDAASLWMRWVICENKDIRYQNSRILDVFGEKPGLVPFLVKLYPWFSIWFSITISTVKLSFYQVIFRHLLYCRYVERKLVEVWVDHQYTKELGLDSSFSPCPAVFLRILMQLTGRLKRYMKIAIL